MTIPLIQQEGPFQALQRTVQAIQEQRQQRQAQQLQQLLGQTQLQQARGEVAMQPLRQQALQAGTEQTRASTAATTGETSRAQTLFDKRQEEDQEIRGALDLLRGVTPDAPDYDQRLAAALTAIRSPEGKIRFRDALRAEGEAQTVAQAAQATREQLALDAQNRVLNRQRVTALTARVASDPAFRRLWEELGDPAVAEYRIAQLRNAASSRDANAQAEMARRQVIIDAIRGARSAWEDQMKAYNTAGGLASYYYYDPQGNLRQYDAQNAPLGAARPVPREQMFRAAAYKNIADDLGITPEAVSALMRQMMIPTTGRPATGR